MRKAALRARCRYPSAVNLRPPPASTATGSVLSIRPFRRLWVATSLSSLGDWLSLLALSTPRVIRTFTFIPVGFFAAPPAL